MSTRRRERVDFVVLGAGPVGLASAIALKQSGRSVVLIAQSLDEMQAAQAPELAAELDLRVYALAPDVLDYLHALGCALRAQPRCQPYQRMHVADQDERVHIVFDSAEYAWPDLGCIVEHQLLQRLLWQQLLALDITVVPMQAQRVERAEAGVLVHGENETVRAHWLIDATGAQSSLRGQLGIDSRVHDYQQAAIVAHLKTDLPAPATAWQRFVPEGTIALLPMADQNYALVYSALNARAEALMAMEDEAFTSELLAQFGSALTKAHLLGPRRKIPLRRLLAQRYQEDCMILIGDSAHQIHPLAGQGLNLGMRDVQCLLRELGELPVAQFPRAVARFARERKSENAITVLAVESLQKLFLPSSGPLALVRRLGLGGVQRITAIKRLFAELATGKLAAWGN